MSHKSVLQTYLLGQKYIFIKKVKAYIFCWRGEAYRKYFSVLSKYTRGLHSYIKWKTMFEVKSPNFFWCKIKKVRRRRKIFLNFFFEEDVFKEMFKKKSEEEKIFSWKLHQNQYELCYKSWVIYVMLGYISNFSNCITHKNLSCDDFMPVYYVFITILELSQSGY